MATLQSVVQDMGRDDVLEILELAKQKCAPAENSAGLGSRDCDSGIDSQSASAGVSHGMDRSLSCVCVCVCVLCVRTRACVC